MKSYTKLLNHCRLNDYMHKAALATARGFDDKRTRLQLQTHAASTTNARGFNYKQSLSVGNGKSRQDVI